jgi:hypothetical protein
MPSELCKACNEPLDPAASDVVYAVELIDASTMEDPNATTDGPAAYFHDAHVPTGHPGYRRTTKPA